MGIVLQVCHQDAVFQNAIVGRKRLTEEVDTGMAGVCK